MTIWIKRGQLPITHSVRHVHDTQHCDKVCLKSHVTKPNQNYGEIYRSWSLLEFAKVKDRFYNLPNVTTLVYFAAGANAQFLLSQKAKAAHSGCKFPISRKNYAPQYKLGNRWNIFSGVVSYTLSEFPYLNGKPGLYNQFCPRIPFEKCTWAGNTSFLFLFVIENRYLFASAEL